LTGIARSNGKNSLHLAARSGYIDFVRDLLLKDPQMAQRKDKKGHTIMHMASNGANCLDVVKELL